jgi:hypothetical protein
MNQLAPEAPLTDPTIWQTSPDLTLLNETAEGCVISHLGIEFADLGPDHLTACTVAPR